MDLYFHKGLHEKALIHLKNQQKTDQLIKYLKKMSIEEVDIVLEYSKYAFNNYNTNDDLEKSPLQLRSLLMRTAIAFQKKKHYKTTKLYVFV